MRRDCFQFFFYLVAYFQITDEFLYIIFGLHALHVLGGIVTLIVLFFRSLSSRIRNYNTVPVEVAATYWHFVDLLWLYLFVFFILIH